MTSIILNSRLYDPDVRDLYVNTSTGSDTASGSQTDPLLTVQEAVNRFESTLFNDEWAIDDSRTIYVTGDVQESVLCRGHPGPGALKIISEDVSVLQTLTQSGSPATIARTSGNHFVRHAITYTTPIDGSVVGDSGAYVVPNPLPSSDIFEECYEYLPVVDVSGSTLDVDIVGPGVLSGFGHTNAASVEVRSPSATWEPADSTAVGLRFFGNYCINNPTGSPLIIEGFRVRPAANGFDGLDVFLVNGPGFSGSVNTLTVIQGCVFDELGGAAISPFTGKGVTFNGVFNGSGLFSNKEISESFILNARFVDGFALKGGINHHIYGADCGGVFAILSANVETTRLDTEGQIQVVDSFVRFQAVSVESGVSSCLSIGQGGIVNVAQALGNNQLYGLSTSTFLEPVFITGPNGSLVAPSSNIANFNFSSSAANDLRIVGTTNTLQGFAAGSAGTDYANVYVSD